MSNSPRQIHVHLSNAESGGKETKRRMPVGSLVTAIASIVAALLAALASILVSRTQSEINNKISTHQTTTQRLIANGQQATTEEIARLQESTKLELSDVQSEIKRLEIFKELVPQLAADDQAGFAVIILWKLFETDRELVVAAALAASPAARDALVWLGGDVASFLRDVPESLRNEAESVLLRIGGENEAKFLIDAIQRADRVAPYDSNVKALISLTKEDESVAQLVEQVVSGVRGPIMTYALYAAERDRANWFVKLLQPAQTDIADFPDVSLILRFGDFEDRDWIAIIDLALKAIEDDRVRDFDRADAVDILGNHQIDRRLVDSQTREAVVRVCQSYFSERSRYPYVRSNAVRTLAKWSPEAALAAISRTLAAGESDTAVLNSINGVLEGQGSPGLRTTFQHLAVPVALAGKDAWIAWWEANRVVVDAEMPDQ